MLRSSNVPYKHESCIFFYEIKLIMKHFRSSLNTQLNSNTINSKIETLLHFS